MYRYACLLLTLAWASAASAEGCVAGIAIVGSRHADNSAVGDVVFVNTYPSVRACNESMAEASKNPLSHPALEGSAPFASFTYACKVPPDCNAPDADQIKPLHKVLIWAK